MNVSIGLSKVGFVGMNGINVEAIGCFAVNGSGCGGRGGAGIEDNVK